MLWLSSFAQLEYIPEADIFIRRMENIAEWLRAIGRAEERGASFAIDALPFVQHILYSLNKKQRAK
jgi:hypothetical protein